MAKVSAMEEDGAATGGAAVAALPAQCTGDVDADALVKGAIDGGAGAPAGVVFAFSPEQVQGALEATGAALATMTDALHDELKGRQIKLLNGYLPEFAGALATELAAHVQVAVHKL